MNFFLFYPGSVTASSLWSWIQVVCHIEICNFAAGLTSLVDLEWFILNPDPVLNFPSSESRLKFRIHPELDPSTLFKNIWEIIKNTFNNSKRRIYQRSAIFISYYSPTVHSLKWEMGTILIHLLLHFAGSGSRQFGSRQKFRSRSGSATLGVKPYFFVLGRCTPSPQLSTWRTKPKMRSMASADSSSNRPPKGMTGNEWIVDGKYGMLL